MARPTRNILAGAALIKHLELERSTHALCAKIFSGVWIIPAIIFDHHFNTSFFNLLVASCRTALSLLVFSLAFICLGKISERSAREQQRKFILSPVILGVQGFIAGGISGVAAHAMLNALGGDTFTLLDRVLQPAILAATWIPLIALASVEIASIRDKNHEYRVEANATTPHSAASGATLPIKDETHLIREILGSGHERWVSNIKQSLHALSYQSEWWILVLLIQGTLLSGVTGSLSLIEEFELLFILGAAMSALLIAFQLISLPKGALTISLIPIQLACTAAITYWLTSRFISPGSVTRSQAAWDNRLFLTIAVTILCFAARMTLLYISYNLTEDFHNFEIEKSKKVGYDRTIVNELTAIKDLLEDLSVLPEQRKPGVELCHKSLESDIKELEKQWVGLIFIEGKIHRNVRIASLKTVSLIGILLQEAFAHAYRDRGASDIHFDVSARDTNSLSIEIIDNGIGKLPTLDNPRVGMQIFSTASHAEFELHRDDVTARNHFRITIPND